MPISITGLFTPSGGADAFDLLTWHDCDNHNWAANAAPGIDNDINDYAVATGGYVVGSLWIDTTADKAYICLDNTNHAAVWTEITGAGGAGAPTDAHYLVGEADGDLSEEIVVGATPGGELGGTWGSPTVDATHSGSAHHAAVTVAPDLSPLITLSTQELSFAVQNANKVLAGPTSGADADPTIRALVAADIPDVSATYVPKSLYDAQSVLAATNDNTPAAVTVATQTVVGRLTGGNIDDIVIGIADDNIVQVDQYDVADNDYAKWTAAGLEGRSYAEVKQDLDLEDADIKALAVTGVEAEATLDLAGAVTVAGASLGVDHIVEKTATHGVDIDGVLCKDDAVETDAIRGLRETTGPTSLAMGAVADGQYLKRDGVTVIGAAGGAGDVATDPIWDAAGDLAVGSGANTAGRLAKGDDGKVLTMVAGAVAWAAAAGGGAMATDPLWDALGDLAYGTGADTGAKLAGNITTTKNWLTQTGDGGASAAPAWQPLTASHSIANNAIVTVDDAAVADNDYAKFTGNGIEGRTYAEVKQDLDLEDADITTLAKTVKLDDLTAPDANTDLNASTTAHGLMIAAVDPASAVQRHVVCIDNGETIYKNADLFDDTHPEAIGTATEGTSLLASHRDHVHAGKVTRCVVFSKTGSLTQNVPMAPYRICVGESGEHGTFAALRATATAGTAGGAGTTILIQADDNPAFSSAVTLFTIALGASTEATDATLDNAWDVAGGDIWIRAFPNSVSATAPQDVVVQFWFTEAVWA